MNATTAMKTAAMAAVTAAAIAATLDGEVLVDVVDAVAVSPVAGVVVGVYVREILDGTRVEGMRVWMADGMDTVTP
jgi:hypothetical protein